MKQNNYYLSQNPLLKLKQEIKLRNFNNRTVSSYLYYITTILNYANKNPKTIKTEDIRNYLENYIEIVTK